MFKHLLYDLIRRKRPACRLEPLGTDTKHIVVLAHGVLLCGSFMLFLGKFLQRNGYEVYLYDYKSSRAAIAEHARQYRAFLQHLAETLPADRVIDVIGHSMGGLLNRCAFDQLAQETLPTTGLLRPPRFEHLIMLATPNFGSRAADAWLKRVPGCGKLVRALPDLRYGENGAASSMPQIRHLKIGIVAVDTDHCVEESSTHLKYECDHIVLPGTHTGMLFDHAVCAQVLHFLQHDCFDHSEKAKTNETDWKINQ